MRRPMPMESTISLAIMLAWKRSGAPMPATRCEHFEGHKVLRLWGSRCSGRGGSLGFGVGGRMPVQMFAG